MSIIVFSQELAQQLVESSEQFPVDFELAWQWLGYSTKQKAKNKLLNNFEQNIDYTLTQLVKRVEGNRGGGSVRFEQINLTIDAFKSLGMMAGTEQGKEIRKYFLNCERIVKDVLPAQNDRIRELELQLELAQTNERLANSQSKLLATVQLLEAVSPGLAPLALGKADAVVERVEYIEKIIDKSQNRVTEGVGIGYLTKRFGFKNNQQTWQWLESIGYGKMSGKWELQLAAIETPKLPKEELGVLARQMKSGIRQTFLGES